MTDTGYVVGDALDVLESLESNVAALCHLDDAWSRPGRQVGEFGVKYPTHGFDETATLLEEIHRVLEPGGWLIADADDWLLPRLLDHLRQEWGDVPSSSRYSGGGYRRVGGVVYVDAVGDADTSTPGQYLSNAGYPVVFAHAGETERRSTVGARQPTRHPRRQEPQYPYGWGSIKPTAPYRRWIEDLTDADDLVLVPCAGTAPAAIAADDLGRSWLAVDVEPEAQDAFGLRRRTRGLQQSLGEATDEDGGGRR